MYIRERSQENKFVMRVFPNTTVNFQKHLEHTRKSTVRVTVGHPTITTREKI